MNNAAATWFASIADSADSAIVRARDIVKAIRGAEGTASQYARARSVARESLYLAVEDRRAADGSRSSARLVADHRLDSALSAVDYSGATREALKACIREIRSVRDADRTSFRNYNRAYTGELSALSAGERQHAVSIGLR